MNTPAEGSALTFDWPRRERFPFLLFVCVFLSFVAHLATFFLFQVIYPPRVTIPAPPPLVEVLDASLPEHAALLRWIAAEDPALVASAHAVLPPRLLEVNYQPSFATPRTALRGSVETPVTVAFPPAIDPVTMLQRLTPAAEPPARAAVATPSSVHFAGGLSQRPLARPIGFRWTERAAEPADALRALLGVNARGEVRHVFLQQSSGQAALDRAALAQLQDLSFEPANTPIIWGFATVTFGAEAYAEARTAEIETTKTE